MVGQSRWKMIVVFLAPAIFFYGLFIVWPYLQAFYFSFVRWRGLSPVKLFIGLGNFKTLMSDTYFWNAFLNTLFFLVTSSLIVPAVAIFFAVVLSRKLVRGSAAYKILFFFPNLISVVAISVLWSFIFNPNFGILSGFLKLTGLEGLAPKLGWLGDPLTAPWCIVTVMVWAQVGFYMVLYLSTLEGIPTDLYDAGKIDGTSEWQSFWHITLPLMREILKVTVVFLILNGFRVFGQIKIMTDGGPNRHTDSIATYLYENAFEFGKFGYASAIAVALFLLTFITAMVSLRLQRRETVQY